MPSEPAPHIPSAVHPSSMLRLPDAQDGDLAMAQFVVDLKGDSEASAAFSAYPQQAALEGARISAVRSRASPLVAEIASVRQ